MSRTKAPILVVEDNAVNRSAVVAMLRALDYDVVAVEDATQALRIASAQAFAAVFMDVRLPNVDGREATKRIRAGDGPNLAAPIIALTATAMREDVERCVLAGMDDVLEKPVSLDDLRLVLERWVPRVAGRGDIPSPFSAGTHDRMVGLFLADARVRLRHLREAAASGDGERATDAAHALNGGAATVGARRLRNACMRLERVVRGGDLSSVSRSLAMIEHELDGLRAGLSDGAAARATRARPSPRGTRRSPRASPR